MADEPSFLDGDDPAVVTTPAPEPVVEAPEPPADGENGDPAAEPTPEPVSEPAPAPAQPESGFVPLAVVLDDREKRQAAERRAQDLERRLQEVEQQREAPATPDPYEDPAGYQAFQDQRFAQAEWNMRLNLSESMVTAQLGKDTVETAKAWALGQGNNPTFVREMQGHPNPYQYVVEAYQRDQFVSQVQPSDYEAFKAWQAAQAAAPQPAPAPAAPQQPAAIPRQSLAGAPSAGGVQTQVVEDPFEAEFSRKR